MEKSIVKSFLGKNGQSIFIQSENGNAVAYTGDTNFYVRTELGLKYSGAVLSVKIPQIFRKQKAALELSDADTLAVEKDSSCSFMKIGGIEWEVNVYPENKIRESDVSGAVIGSWVFTGDMVKRLQHLAAVASKDEGRYYMNGVYFAKNGDIVSTNGQRLALCKTGNQFPGVIIWREAFQFFGKSKEIHMTVYESQEKSGSPDKTLKLVELSDGATTVRTFEVDGNYPNYPRVIPDKKGYAEAEGVNIDFKKFGDYIKSTGSKYKKPVLQLFNDAVYCRDMLVGSLDFNIDPLVIKANYLREAVENVGDKVAWRKILRDRIGEKVGFTEETPYVTKALVFGGDDYFDVVMPQGLCGDNLSAAFDSEIKRISQKSA